MKDLVPRHTAFIQAQRVVPYLTPEEVRFLIDGIKSTRHGQRDCLLILLLFQTGLRISEALSLTPSSIQGFEGKPVLSIVGKGRKPRLVACPERLADSNPMPMKRKLVPITASSR
jgi:site-specific recombinase XerD